MSLIHAVKARDGERCTEGPLYELRKTVFWVSSTCHVFPFVKQKKYRGVFFPQGNARGRRSRPVQTFKHLRYGQPLNTIELESLL